MGLARFTASLLGPQVGSGAWPPHGCFQKPRVLGREYDQAGGEAHVKYLIEVVDIVTNILFFFLPGENITNTRTQANNNSQR